MFSQLRHAVENFATVLPESTTTSTSTAHDRSQSHDVTPSTSSDPTFANLRRSLDFVAPAQRRRAQSPGNNLSSVRSPSAARTPSMPIPSPLSGRKLNLEERLRAKFTIGDESNQTSPDPSARASPVPRKPASDDTPTLPTRSSSPPAAMAIVTEKTSPCSTPLPQSPILSPTIPTSLPSSLSLDSYQCGGGDPLGASPSGTPIVSSSPATSWPAYTGTNSPVDTNQSISPSISPRSSASNESFPLQKDHVSPPDVSSSSPDPPSPIAGTTLPSSDPDLCSSSPSSPRDELATKDLPSSNDAQKDAEAPADEQHAGDADLPKSLESLAEASSDPPARRPELDTSVPSTSESSSSHNVDAMQERLKLVEQRFAEVSASFKRLRAEKTAVDVILQDLTPIDTLSDSEGLRDYLKNLTLKNEMFQQEVKRLTIKLSMQDERIEELRDTHRLESASQSDQIERLRRQVAEAEALLRTSQGVISQGEADIIHQKAEAEKLQKDVELANARVKEEEEKRTKAITLLKTVRQKLVKSEKDREDLAKELSAVQEKEKIRQANENADREKEREKEQQERTRLQNEIEVANAERERAVAGLKAQFDKEVVSLKERHDKEMVALRSQLELDAITAKSAHDAEIASQSRRITALEASVQSLSSDKALYFEQSQLRQGELESARAHLETLQREEVELQYQLREAQERIALLTENLTEAQRNYETLMREPNAAEADRVAVEAKYEKQLADLGRNIATLERERGESEAQWARKLREKVRALDELKESLGAASRNKEQGEEAVDEMKRQLDHLTDENQEYQKQVLDLQRRIAKTEDREDTVKEREREVAARITVLERQVEESRTRESQIRATNKTLREELRKVQSSAALLERQRNPGVGYWTTRTENVAAASSPSLASARPESPRPPSASKSPTPSFTPPSSAMARSASSMSAQDEEAINLEYLRNVILQFLEHKDMRPSLVKVMSIILHFTPQEMRRLTASLKS